MIIAFRSTFILLISLSIIVSINGLYLHNQQYPINNTYCYKNTTTRQGGIVPDQCRSNQDKIGLYCYQKCPRDYERVGFDCQLKCNNRYSGRGQSSCSSKVIKMQPQVMTCSKGKVYDNGLCYDSQCPKNSQALGPLCWGINLDSFNCGLIATQNQTLCYKLIKDQVIQAGFLAYNIANKRDSSQIQKVLEQGQKIAEQKQQQQIKKMQDKKLNKTRSKNASNQTKPSLGNTQQKDSKTTRKSSSSSSNTKNKNKKGSQKENKTPKLNKNQLLLSLRTQLQILIQLCDSSQTIRNKLGQAITQNRLQALTAQSIFLINPQNTQLETIVRIASSIAFLLFPQNLLNLDSSKNPSSCQKYTS